MSAPMTMTNLDALRGAVRIARACLAEYETVCTCPDEPQCVHAVALESADARVTNAAEAYLDELDTAAPTGPW